MKFNVECKKWFCVNFQSTLNANIDGMSLF